MLVIYVFWRVVGYSGVARVVYAYLSFMQTAFVQIVRAYLVHGLRCSYTCQVRTQARMQIRIQVIKMRIGDDRGSSACL